MMVNVGSEHPCVTKQAPSVTNTFFTSCTWLYAFTTLVFASLPMRAELTSESRCGKGVPINFLPSTAREIVAAQKVFVPIWTNCVYVLGNDVTARAPHRLAHRRPEGCHGTAALLERRVVHQIVAQNALRISDAVRKSRRTRVEQDARGF